MIIFLLIAIVLLMFKPVRALVGLMFMGGVLYWALH
jgi:hypothetical protein